MEQNKYNAKKKNPAGKKKKKKNQRTMTGMINTRDMFQ